MAAVAPPLASWVDDVEEFGLDKENTSGPDRAATTVGEAAGLRQRNDEQEPNPDIVSKAALGGKKILCRVCQGDHFTTKCPDKGTLGLGTGDDMPPPEDGPTTRPEPATNSKYVPPSMRCVTGCRPGESAYHYHHGMNMNRDDMPTLRITNASEGTDEADLRDLFSNFGRVTRVYIGKDRETGIRKGFAFVSFEEKANAERAIQKVHGMVYDNSILSVQWAQPRAG